MVLEPVLMVMLRGRRQYGPALTCRWDIETLIFGRAGKEAVWTLQDVS